MNERAQIFVDQFGTGRGPGGSGRGPHMQFDGSQDWKLAWQGKLELWKAFWIYFVMGHGLVLAGSCAILIASILTGFFVDPGSSAAGATGLAVGVVIVAAIFLGFAIWATVSVWRCADNCTVKIRGTYARTIVVGYVTALALPLVNAALG